MFRIVTGGMMVDMIGIEIDDGTITGVIIDGRKMMVTEYPMRDVMLGVGGGPDLMSQEYLSQEEIRQE